MNLFASWLQVIFPPLCQCCKAKTQNSFLCPLCWERCAAPNPKERCPHCFEESLGLCHRCKKKPFLPFAKASVFEQDEPPRILFFQRPDMMISFMQMQWAQLDWPRPDVIVPMPEAKQLARDWAIAMNCPFADILSQKGTWQCDVEKIEEGFTLLILDKESSIEELLGACQALARTFPKNGYILRLFS